MEERRMKDTKLLSAVKALYDWTFTIEKRWKRVQTELGEGTMSLMAYAAQDELQHVRKEMQTLFAGLIEFEQKQEKQENGL